MKVMAPSAPINPSVLGVDGRGNMEKLHTGVGQLTPLSALPQYSICTDCWLCYGICRGPVQLLLRGQLSTGGSHPEPPLAACEYAWQLCVQGLSDGTSSLPVRFVGQCTIVLTLAGLGTAVAGDISRDHFEPQVDVQYNRGFVVPPLHHCFTTASPPLHHRFTTAPPPLHHRLTTAHHRSPPLHHRSHHRSPPPLATTAPTTAPTTAQPPLATTARHHAHHRRHHHHSPPPPPLHRSPPLTTALTTTAHHRSPPPPPPRHHHRLTTAHHRSPPLTTAHHRSPPLTTAHHRSPPLTTAHHHSPPLTTAHHRSPPLTTAHHRTPPLTTAHYLDSSHCRWAIPLEFEGVRGRPT